MAAAVLTRINGVFVNENVRPFFRDKKKIDRNKMTALPRWSKGGLHCVLV